MTKLPVKGEEVGRGKQLARHKLHLSEKGKRIAPKKKMRGDDEMAKGWVDKSQLAKPAGYISVSERHGVDAASKDPYNNPYRCLCYAERELMEEEKAGGSRDPLSSWENVELRNMFFCWARKEFKVYGTLKESKLRFKVWCANKKITEQHCLKTNQMFSIGKMNLFSDRTLLENSRLCGYKPVEIPFNARTPPPKFERLLGIGAVEKAAQWKEFNEWAQRHKRDYGGSSQERERRFFAYLDNKRKIDLEKGSHPGYWRYGYDDLAMDKFEWEGSIFPDSAPCPRCSASLIARDGIHYSYGIGSDVYGGSGHYYY